MEAKKILKFCIYSKNLSYNPVPAMAGNIIPAIATANAIVAGLAVLRAQGILKGDIENCSSVYLRPKVNHRGQLFVPEKSKYYSLSFIIIHSQI